MKGTAVICIDDRNISRGIAQKPVEGSVYTIRQLKYNPDGSWGVLLNEVKNPLHTIPSPDIGYFIRLEPNFATRRFSDLEGNDISGTEEELLRKSVEEDLVVSDPDTIFAGHYK